MLANILTFVFFAIISILAYFLPLNGNNVLTMELKYTNLISGPAFVWYLFFAALISLAIFIRFQAGNMSISDNLIAKTLDTLGWTPSAAFILYAMAISLWHFERLTLALVVLILVNLVLLITNGNIRENPAVMDEKFWVRIPFSLFFAWTLYLMMTTIAMRWSSVFSDELAAVILLVVFMLLVLSYAIYNMNAGIPMAWLFILIFKQLQYVESYMFRMVAWAGIGAMVFIIFLIGRKDPYQHYFRKPVNRPMAKYDCGKESQIQELEDELNEQLQTKPGNKITFR